MKTRSRKSQKIDIFSKGLTRGFGPKKAIFPNFFLGNLDQENIFYDILEPKNPFLGYQRKMSKKSKNWHFSQLFFFRQFRPGKCLLRYSRTKKFLSRISKEEVQKLEKLTSFSKGITHGFGPKVSIFPTFFF